MDQEETEKKEEEKITYKYIKKKTRRSQETQAQEEIQNSQCLFLWFNCTDEKKRPATTIKHRR